MRMKTEFDKFLRDTVNINKHRLDQLDDRVDAISRSLSQDDELGHRLESMIPQGSWAHETIIKPLEDNEFDADFLVLMEENPEWSHVPKSYRDEVYKAFGRHATYESMRSKKCRCVRITYANDCHVDVVPYVVLSDGRKVIVNGEANEWEDTDPEGFTAWMKDKDDITGGNLRRVIRLLKYLRDHKGTFDGVRSVILTTVVGERVSTSKTLQDSAYYEDVPTALKNIVADLDAWLQANLTKPSIADPSGSGTTFDHRWTEPTYQNFRTKLHAYANDIHDAYYAETEEDCLKAWRKIFGDEFGEDNDDDSGGGGGGRRTPLLPVPSTPSSRSGRAG